MTNRFIDLTPTWQEAAAIIAAALENGTDRGRVAARAELFRMAALLDELDSTATPDDPARYMIARIDTDPNAPRFYTDETRGRWTADAADALRFNGTDAAQLRDDLADHAAVTSRTSRFAVIAESETPTGAKHVEMTADEIERLRHD